MPDERPSNKPVSAPQEGADTTRDPSDPWSLAIAAIDDCARLDALLDLARDTWVEHAATGRAPTHDEVRDKAKALELSDDDLKQFCTGAHPGDDVGALSPDRATLKVIREQCLKGLEGANRAHIRANGYLWGLKQAQVAIQAAKK